MFTPIILTGLGTLSYAHPRFAIKLLSLLLVILIFAQAFLSGYGSVWADEQTMTEREIVHAFSPCDSLIGGDRNKPFSKRATQYKILLKEHEKTKESVNQILVSSSDRMKQFNKNCDYFFCIAYAVIIILGVFSFQFLKYKANRKLKEE